MVADDQTLSQALRRLPRGERLAVLVNPPSPLRQALVRSHDASVNRFVAGAVPTPVWMHGFHAVDAARPAGRRRLVERAGVALQSGEERSDRIPTTS